MSEGNELPGQEIEMEHEPTLLYALKKLLNRSISEYWPVEQEIAWWAIEIAEKEAGIAADKNKTE